MEALTQENYYNNEDWLSNSRFKRYMGCQAKAYAVDNDDWVEERDNTPLLVGNYVHSYFESKEAHERFIEENKSQILAKTGKNKGKPKAEYAIAEAMIKTLDTDPKFNLLYHGYSDDKVEKEMIVTGEVEGVPIKGKIDSINLSRGYFVDLKTMKSIQAEEWNGELRKKIPAVANSILSWGYHVQLALYRELLKQQFGAEFRPVVVAVSKEAVPDKELIRIDDKFLEYGLEDFKMDVGQVWAVIQGEAKPTKCGKCDYCRAHKQLSRMVSLSDLIYGD